MGVALGNFANAVIVDTTEAARSCVRYLKEHMLAPMTFLPLLGLKVSQLDRLHEAVNSNRTLRLAINCVSFNEQLSQAFDFLLGDVVIADTMADGRKFTYGDARELRISCKIVTLTGEAIAKNG